MGELMKEIITDDARLDPSVFREGNPWRVVVDLNEACNLKCSYCHIDALFGKDARDSR